jgi:hypothetical protein
MVSAAFRGCRQPSCRSPRFRPCEGIRRCAAGTGSGGGQAALADSIFALSAFSSANAASTSAFCCSRWAI